MTFCDVVDQFLNKNGLTNAGTAEQTNLTALCVRASRSITLIPVTRMAASVDWSTNAGASAWIGQVISAPTGPRSSIGSPITFMIRPSVSGPTGTESAHRCDHFLTTGQALGRVHSDGTDGVFAEVLCNFENQRFAVLVFPERTELLAVLR